MILTNTQKENLRRNLDEAMQEAIEIGLSYDNPIDMEAFYQWNLQLADQVVVPGSVIVDILAEKPEKLRYARLRALWYGILPRPDFYAEDFNNFLMTGKDRTTSPNRHIEPPTQIGIYCFIMRHPCWLDPKDFHYQPAYDMVYALSESK